MCSRPQASRSKRKGVPESSGTPENATEKAQGQASAFTAASTAA